MNKLVQARINKSSARIKESEVEKKSILEQYVKSRKNGVSKVRDKKSMKMTCQSRNKFSHVMNNSCQAEVKSSSDKGKSSQERSP